MSQTFVVHLRGASFANADGSDRQPLIGACREGEQLTLRAEPSNPHDRHAIAVLNSQDQQLGYLPSDARDAAAILRGEGVSATVLKKIGGPRWWHGLLGIERSYGLLIRLTKADVDWNAHNQHRETAQVVDTLVKQAVSLEKSGASPDEVIARYTAAMAAVTALNGTNSVAAAHRYEQAPINRLTMLLVKQKRHLEACKAYADWNAVHDPVGLQKSDREAVEKRMTKLGVTGAT